MMTELLLTVLNATCPAYAPTIKGACPIKAAEKWLKDTKDDEDVKLAMKYWKAYTGVENREICEARCAEMKLRRTTVRNALNAAR